MTEQSPKRSGPRFNDWRARAIVILGAVASRGVPPNEVEEFSRTHGAERAWLTEVVSGVLRCQGRIDTAIDTLALKKKPTGWLRRALRVAVYSLLYQDGVAPAAIVSESVDLIRSREGAAPGAFTNALLRKVADHAAQFRAPAFPRSVSDQARWACMPEWFWKRLVSERGEAQARALAEAALVRPEIWFLAKPGAPGFEEELARAGFVAGPLPRSLRLGAELSARGGAIPELPGFKTGQWIVQDLSSQQIAAEFAAELRGSETERSGALRGLDGCAAPGGKSVALAWHGLSVVATDRTERLGLLRDTLARTQAAVAIDERGLAAVLGDAALSWDWIWIDAPCSSSGVIRRHPEIRVILREDTLAGLARTQAQLLSTALERMLAQPSAGAVLYSVCSLFRAEGAEVVEGVLARLKSPRLRLARSWDLPITADSDGFWAGLVQVKAQ